MRKYVVIFSVLILAASLGINSISAADNIVSDNVILENADSGIISDLSLNPIDDSSLSHDGLSPDIKDDTRSVFSHDIKNDTRYHDDREAKLNYANHSRNHVYGDLQELDMPDEYSDCLCSFVGSNDLCSCLGCSGLCSCAGSNGLCSCAGSNGLCSCVGCNDLCSCAGCDGLCSCAGCDGLCSCAGCDGLCSCAGCDGLCSCVGTNDLCSYLGSKGTCSDISSSKDNCENTNKHSDNLVLNGVISAIEKNSIRPNMANLDLLGKIKDTKSFAGSIGKVLRDAFEKFDAKSRGTLAYGKCSFAAKDSTLTNSDAKIHSINVVCLNHARLNHSVFGKNASEEFGGLRFSNNRMFLLNGLFNNIAGESGAIVVDNRPSIKNDNLSDIERFNLLIENNSINDNKNVIADSYGNQSNNNLTMVSFANAMVAKTSTEGFANNSSIGTMSESSDLEAANEESSAEGRDGCSVENMTEGIFVNNSIKDPTINNLVNGLSVIVVLEGPSVYNAIDNSFANAISINQSIYALNQFNVGLQANSIDKIYGILISSNDINNTSTADKSLVEPGAHALAKTLGLYGDSNLPMEVYLFLCDSLYQNGEAYNLAIPEKHFNTLFINGVSIIDNNLMPVSMDIACGNKGHGIDLLGIDNGIASKFRGLTVADSVLSKISNLVFDEYGFYLGLDVDDASVVIAKYLGGDVKNLKHVCHSGCGELCGDLVFGVGTPYDNLNGALCFGDYVASGDLLIELTKDAVCRQGLSLGLALIASPVFCEFGGLTLANSVLSELGNLVLDENGFYLGLDADDASCVNEKVSGGDMKDFKHVIHNGCGDLGSGLVFGVGTPYENLNGALCFGDYVASGDLLIKVTEDAVCRQGHYVGFDEINPEVCKIIYFALDEEGFYKELGG